MASPYGWDRFQNEWSDERLEQFVQADQSRDRADRVVADVRAAAKVLAQAEAAWNDEFPDDARADHPRDPAPIRGAALTRAPAAPVIRPR